MFHSRPLFLFFASVLFITLFSFQGFGKDLASHRGAQAARSAVSFDKATDSKKKKTGYVEYWQKRSIERRKRYNSIIQKRREARQKRIASVRKKQEERNRANNKSRNYGREAGTLRWDSGFFTRRKTKREKVAEPKPTTVHKGNYGQLIAKYAKMNGVPYGLARAVVFAESNFRAHVTGSAGEIGLMQIKLSTARGMGYKGSRKQLYNPATNLYWGMKYLGKAHRLAGGSTCGTILKYNAGHYAKRHNPVSRRYCQKVSRYLA